MRKIYLSILLFVSAACYCYSQSTLSIQSGLTNLEDFVINIENESLQQKQQINNLEQQLNNANLCVENLQNQLTEISQQQEKQSKLLENYEMKSHGLKIALTVSVIGNLITIPILIKNLKR